MAEADAEAALPPKAARSEGGPLSSAKEAAAASIAAGDDASDAIARLAALAKAKGATLRQPTLAAPGSKPSQARAGAPPAPSASQPSTPAASSAGNRLAAFPPAGNTSQEIPSAFCGAPVGFLSPCLSECQARGFGGRSATAWPCRGLEHWKRARRCHWLRRHECRRGRGLTQRRRGANE